MELQRVTALPDGPNWLYEVKWDGYRCLAAKRGDEVRLLSRNAKDLGGRFSQVVDALAAVRGPAFLLDGELVALDAHGHPSFKLLTRPRDAAAIVYYAFDLLAMDGRWLVTAPLVERRRLLESLLGGSAIRLSRALPGTPTTILEHVRKHNLEGIVAKLAQSQYLPGARPGTWVKMRVGLADDFLVGGWLPGANGVAALLVGRPTAAGLSFVAAVRAGLTPEERRVLARALNAMPRARCPFVAVPRSGARWVDGLSDREASLARWVAPRLVARVGGIEWTTRGGLRHAELLGLRDDMRPERR